MTKKRRGDGFDWSEWKGTDTLRWTQIPDDWLDTLIPQLGEAEVRVLLCIGRHTYGWKKDWDRISLNQIMRDTGLSRAAASRAAKSLEEKDIVRVERRVSTDGGPEANLYSPVEKATTPSSSKILPPSSFELPTRNSRTRDNNENERPSVSSQSIPNDKTQLLAALATEFAPEENPQAILTYLSRFPVALLTQAAQVTRESDNKHKPIAYLYGVVQRLSEQEALRPLAQQRAELLPELSEEEYQASLQALDRVKQQQG